MLKKMINVSGFLNKKCGAFLAAGLVHFLGKNPSSKNFELSIYDFFLGNYIQSAFWFLLTEHHFFLTLL